MIKRFLISLLSFTIVTGCTSSTTRTKIAITEPEKVVNVSIPEYNNNAIIAINISRTNTGAESSGSLVGLRIENKASNLLNSTDHTPWALPDIPFVGPLSFSSNHDAHNTLTLLPTSFSVDSLTHNTSTYTFTVRDFENNGTKNIIASLKYGSATSKCLIYADSAFNDATANWATLGSYFDNTVFPTVTTHFTSHGDVDGNSKDIILYYDIKPSQNINGTILGYVNLLDLLSGISITNYNNHHNTKEPIVQKDIIYLNTQIFNHYSSTKNKETIAHEYQHLVSNHQKIRQANGGTINLFETWIEESLAESAAHMCLNQALPDQIAKVKSDTSLINNGTGFITWQSKPENYTLTYLFLQYLRTQSKDNTGIYQLIQNQTARNYQAIENVIKTQTDNFQTFQDMLIGFHIANVVNIPNSIYGYQNERDVFDFSQLPAGSNDAQKSIYPGGRVIMYPSQSVQDQFNPSNSGYNMRFYKINSPTSSTTSSQ